MFFDILGEFCWVFFKVKPTPSEFKKRLPIGVFKGWPLSPTEATEQWKLLKKLRLKWVLIFCQSPTISSLFILSSSTFCQALKKKSPEPFDILRGQDF